MNNKDINLKKVNKEDAIKKNKRLFDFNKEQFGIILELYRMGCTDKQIITKYGISQNTYYEWKKRQCSFDKELTNREKIDQAKNDMYLRLYDKAFDLALNKDNVPMLKYIMANKLGWSDKVEQKVDTTQSVKIVNNDSEDIETLGEYLDNE